MQNIGAITNTVVTAAPNSGVEAVIASLGFVIPGRDVAPILFVCSVQCQPNALTGYTLNIRRGATAAGVLVIGTGVVAGGFTVSVINNFNFSGQVVEQNSGPVQYSLCYLAAGANCSITTVSFAALLL